VVVAKVVNNDSRAPAGVFEALSLYDYEDATTLPEISRKRETKRLLNRPD
jgi:hypothetical protein